MVCPKDDLEQFTYESVEGEQEDENAEGDEDGDQCDTLVHADLHYLAEAEFLSVHPVRQTCGPVLSAHSLQVSLVQLILLVLQRLYVTAGQALATLAALRSIVVFIVATIEVDRGARGRLRRVLRRTLL